jgi:hypothetical protein
MSAARDEILGKQKREYIRQLNFKSLLKAKNSMDSVDSVGFHGICNPQIKQDHYYFA